MFLNHFHILSLQISRALVILLTPEKQTLLYIYIYILSRENRENAKTSRTHIVNFESRKIKKRLTLKYQSVTFYFFFVNTALATKTTITITATMIIMFMFDSSEVVFCTTANVCIKLSKSIYNIPAIIMHIGIKL